MFRVELFFSLLSAFIYGSAAMAQNADSLIRDIGLLIQENNRYIKMAQDDELITASQAETMREIVNDAVEKPHQIGLDILFQIRDSIDCKYDDQMRVINATPLEMHYLNSNSLLPSKLEIPADYISPEEREEARRELAMKQMAESIARDFEKEKLPIWQVWWRKQIRLFFGNMAWFRREVTYINGQEVLIPQREDKR